MLYISTAFDTRFIFSEFEMKVFKTNHLLFWFSGFLGSRGLRKF